jgi:hypothetical protein
VHMPCVCVCCVCVVCVLCVWCRDRVE